ncbi:hypothetical protein LZC95_44575 [Pendulispora brunnea]|uniref:N-acetyltransferase domain-containing protein n=1 Tax=Pendulispora brunnea TaxID=2905690 RepID=A0ABZ2KAW0_9BACT
MAAKAWATADKADKKAEGEIFFQNDSVSLCLLVQRRTKTMRVIDFRAGPTPAKRTFVLSLARREGVEKVYTVVERDEVSTWVKLGFTKEGNIPAFYKRSDAFLLGCSVEAQARVPAQSERRIIAPASRAQPSDPGSLARTVPRSSIASRSWLDPERLPDDEVDAPVDTSALDFAEKTLLRAKKHVKELAERALPAVKLTEIQEAATRKPLAAALRSGRALTAFEAFGRGVERRYFAATGRAGFELLASVESQPCFGNAFVEILSSPRNEGERVATAIALKGLCERLFADGTVGCFALAPSDDAGLATAFVYNGFRRTGVLQNHLVVGRERKDAIVFARKLANPGGE